MIEKDRIHQGFLIKATGPEKGNWDEFGEQRRRAADSQLVPISQVVLNDPNKNNNESSEERVRAAHRQLEPISGVVLNDPKNTGVVVSDAETRARSDNRKFRIEKKRLR
jgi:hypothetical protein